MKAWLSPGERRELAEAIGAKRARELEPVFIHCLKDYAKFHSAMSVTEFKEHAAPLIKVLRRAGVMLHEAPGELLWNFYWPTRLQETLGQAIIDLERVCFEVPKHRDRDARRLLVLTECGEQLVASGVPVSEYEGSPFSRALRVALLAMDRLVKRQYRGRPPMHDTMQPIVRAVKRALQRRTERSNQLQKLRERGRTLRPRAAK